MSNHCLLHTAYWPNIQYLSKVFFFDEFFIENYETYPKQTFRNRCEIYTANGKNSLQVPVVKGSFKKILIKDLKISYDTNWQKNHFKAIESAYRSTPFYDFYVDDLLPFYQKKFNFLIDFNSQILNTILSWLDIDKNIVHTQDYHVKFEGADYRETFSPKVHKQTQDLHFKPVKYMQGFEQRHGFISNLSALDLVFNCGQESVQILRQSIHVNE